MSKSTNSFIYEGIELPIEVKKKWGYKTYKVGDRRLGFRSKWRRNVIRHDMARLSSMAKSKKSDTCIIVGNGPSLNEINFDLLEGHDVIISNNAYESDELLSRASYFTVVNYLVAEQSSANISALRKVTKVFPLWLSYCLLADADTCLVETDSRAKFYSRAWRFSCRHTVSYFNLHLAWHLGFKKVVLVGFDHKYTQPKGTKEGDIIFSEDEDPNHFFSSYFRGKQWQGANVERMEEMYRLAYTIFQVNGREVVNATVGGDLEVFPRQALSEALI